MQQIQRKPVLFVDLYDCFDNLENVLTIWNMFCIIVFLGLELPQQFRKQSELSFSSIHLCDTLHFHLSQFNREKKPHTT